MYRKQGITSNGILQKRHHRCLRTGYGIRKCSRFSLGITKQERYYQEKFSTTCLKQRIIWCIITPRVNLPSRYSISLRTPAERQKISQNYTTTLCVRINICIWLQMRYFLPGSAT